MRHTKSRTRRAADGALVMLAATTLVVVAGSAAEAKNEYHYWNSDSNTLKVDGYGSHAQAYGQWRLADGSNGTRSWLDARTYYTNADNHKVYDTLTTQTNCKSTPDGTSCGTYLNLASKETEHYNVAGSWKWLYASTEVDGISNSARAKVAVCIDVPWQTDPCSGASYAGPSSY